MQTFMGVMDSLRLAIQNKADEKGWSQKLSSKYFWDIVTLLRGPDEGNGKKTVTGRVRAIIGITPDNAPRGLVLNPNAPDEGDTWDDVLASPNVNLHYKEHLRTGAIAIKEVFDIDLLNTAPKFQVGDVVTGPSGVDYIVAHVVGRRGGPWMGYNLINLEDGEKYFKEYRGTLKDLAKDAKAKGFEKD